MAIIKNYITCNENIKYKISTPYTKVIEFFQIKADDEKLNE